MPNAPRLPDMASAGRIQPACGAGRRACRTASRRARRTTEPAADAANPAERAAAAFRYSTRDAAEPHRRRGPHRPRCPPPRCREAARAARRRRLGGCSNLHRRGDRHFAAVLEHGLVENDAETRVGVAAGITQSVPLARAAPPSRGRRASYRGASVTWPFDSKLCDNVAVTSSPGLARAASAGRVSVALKLAAFGDLRSRFARRSAPRYRALLRRARAVAVAATDDTRIPCERRFAPPHPAQPQRHLSPLPYR